MWSFLKATTRPATRRTPPTCPGSSRQGPHTARPSSSCWRRWRNTSLFFGNQASRCRSQLSRTASCTIPFPPPERKPGCGSLTNWPGSCWATSPASAQRLAPRGVPWQNPIRHGTPWAPGYSGALDKAELAERGDTIVKADLLGDDAILNLQYGGAGDPHCLAGASRQRANRHVIERPAGVGAA